MYRSTNKLARPLQVALCGAPGTGKEQFFALLGEALKTGGLAAEIAMPAVLNVPFKADTIFLMGLQGTCAAHAEADVALRQLLALHKLPYQVLYGSNKECLAQAIALICSRVRNTQEPGSLKAIPAEDCSESVRQWVWVCDKCSDPQCEHRLLTSLLSNRSALSTEQLP